MAKGHMRTIDRPKEIQELVELLVPKTCLFILQTKTAKGNKIEPYYNTEYALEEIAASKLEKWATVLPRYDEPLDICPPNIFVPRTVP